LAFSAKRLVNEREDLLSWTKSRLVGQMTVQSVTPESRANCTLTACCSDRSRHAASDSGIWQSRPLPFKWQDPSMVRPAEHYVGELAFWPMHGEDPACSLPRSLWASRLDVIAVLSYVTVLLGLLFEPITFVLNVGHGIWQFVVDCVCYALKNNGLYCRFGVHSSCLVIICPNWDRKFNEPGR
jgi:hypothetical protein